MDETEESISMADLRKGCQVAWGQASPLLYRAILGVVNRMGRPDLEDIASELIVNKILPEFRAGAGAFAEANDFRHLLNLVKKSASYRAIDAIRRSGRRKESPLPENWEEYLGGTHEDPHEAEEGLARFSALISILKPPKPEIFEDRFIEELSYEEIARKRGMTTGVVGSHLFRGMKQIREYLDGKQESED